MAWCRGAERPELLITETLAFHDRRCEKDKISPPPPERPNYDLDQRLKPRGSMFVELYNPWSPDGEKPAEFYGKPASALANAEEGVMLNRLSDVGVTISGTTKYSPVWRMMVLRDPIGGSLTNQAEQLLQSDPDGYRPPGIDLEGERWVYFTTGPSGGDPNRSDDDRINGDYTSGATKVLKADNTDLQVWVPPVPYVTYPPTAPLTPAGKRYFIARTDRQPGTSLQPANDTDVEIAPILPGRYAVVGSSGLQLSGPGASDATQSTPQNGPPPGDIERFVTPISRLPVTGGAEQTDTDHHHQLNETRRIELWPSIDPDVQQLLVDENGGPEFVRTSTNNYINVTDSDLDGMPDVPRDAGKQSRPH